MRSGVSADMIVECYFGYLRKSKMKPAGSCLWKCDFNHVSILSVRHMRISTYISSFRIGKVQIAVLAEIDQP